MSASTSLRSVIKPGLMLMFFGLNLRMYLDFEFRRSVAQAIIATYYGKRFALRLSRFLLGHALPPVLVTFWYRHPANGGQDDVAYMDHIKYVRRTRYGPHAREELDELLPVVGQEFAHENRVRPKPGGGIFQFLLTMASQTFTFFASAMEHHPHAVPTVLGHVKSDAPAILFGHGGGWVCQGTDVQFGQLPAIARGTGMAMFSFNYALAPEDPFPASLISCLRALSYLKTHRGYQDVALLGESAGGNLITMAAALVCNPKIMKRLAQESGIPCDTYDYPRISCVVSWYSILDAESWKGQGWLWTGLETTWRMYVGDLADLPKGKKFPIEGKASLCQLESDLQHYPPTLLIAGTNDPLGLATSAETCHAMLQRRGVSSEIALYPATHGFIGYPPSIQTALNGGDESHWRENCAVASQKTCEFIKLHHGKKLRTKVLEG